jgi:prepilin-type N-terminal cleavage/methylation domain-containing protein
MLQDRGGFTLVEMVVSLLLILLVITIVKNFFIFGVHIYHQNRDRAEVEENLRLGINRLSRELRHADVVVSYQQDGGGRLSFKNTRGDTITYRISTSGDVETAKQLTRSIGGHGHNPVARYVKKLQVELAGAGTSTGLVTLTLVGEKDGSGEIEVSTTVRIRN